MTLTDKLDVYNGTLVDASDNADLVIDECLLGIQNGKVVFREKIDKLDDLKLEFDFNEDDVHKLSKYQFLMPGFVDIHLHAPQYRIAGNKLHMELLPWLESCTLPEEAKFKDLTYAKDVFDRVVRDTLNHGTTTAVYFSTLHLETSLLLSETVARQGQRAFVGKVSMDVNSPDYYRESTQQSLQDTESFVVKLQDKQNPLVRPIITPRFAPYCSRQLLQFLGSLAKTYNVHVQSHVAENKEECSLVKKLFPECQSYTEIYDNFGLLTPKTVLAHGVYLTDDDIARLLSKGTGIAHCPNSNISLRSGLCDVRNLEKNKLKVGLGTDVAGGYSISILDSIRQALATSKIISFTNPAYEVLTYQEVFRMATLGGCEILGLSESLGTLEVGKQFDALLVDVEAKNNLKYFPDDTPEDIVEKFFHHGDDRNIQKVYVAGKQLK